MEKTVELLKAIADETRLKIILLLSRQEMAVCEFINALNLSQPAVSHHLKILKQAGLVKDNREGKWIFYTIDHQKFKDLGSDLENNLFLPIQEYYKKGPLPSRIRLEKNKGHHTEFPVSINQYGVPRIPVPGGCFKS